LLGPLATPTGEHRRELLATLRTLAPTAVFHSVQGQVTTFLLVLLGTSGQVADLGAISRYQIVFGVCGVILAQVVTPAAARATDPAHYRRLLRTTLLGYAAYSLAAIAAAWLLRRPALALLGAQYLGLRDELILLMFSAALGGLNGLLWNFVSARNWIRHVWVIIPLTLAAQVVLALWLPLDTVSGALVFGAFSTLPATLWFSVLGIVRFNKNQSFTSCQ
jgi:O-antigen/teichoic acid export membrane protein